MNNEDIEYEFTKTTTEQLIMIKKYLESRLSVYDIKEYLFKVDRENEDMDGIIFMTYSIKPKNLGIARYIIKNAKLECKIMPMKKSEHGFINGMVRLMLWYKHYDGGKNGHGLNFNLVFDTEKVFEVDEE